MAQQTVTVSSGVLNPNRADWAAGEVPQRNCSHNNEEIIGSRSDYSNTEIKCVDCGSVRSVASYSQGDDYSHEDAL
jgi:hypothetical protein